MARDASYSSSLLRYPVDRWTVCAVLFTALLCGLPFLTNWSISKLLILWIALLAFRFTAPCAQHCHAHLKVFKHPLPNFLYDIVLAQLTGFTTPEWELQHNRGHHRHFLDPQADVAGTHDDDSGEPLGMLRYVVQGNLRLLPDAYRIALRESDRRTWLFKLGSQVLIQVAVLTAALWLAPGIAASFLFAQALLMRVFVWWGSYWQHHGAPATNVYDGSFTNLSPWLNRVTFNSGHHTSHHERPTLHWSMLPARTAQIRTRIPDECLKTSVF